MLLVSQIGSQRIKKNKPLKIKQNFLKKTFSSSKRCLKSGYFASHGFAAGSKIIFSFNIATPLLYFS